MTLFSDNMEKKCRHTMFKMLFSAFAGTMKGAGFVETRQMEFVHRIATGE